MSSEIDHNVYLFLYNTKLKQSTFQFSKQLNNDTYFCELIEQCDTVNITSHISKVMPYT